MNRKDRISSRTAVSADVWQQQLEIVQIIFLYNIHQSTVSHFNNLLQEFQFIQKFVLCAPRAAHRAFPITFPIYSNKKKITTRNETHLIEMID